MAGSHEESLMSALNSDRIKAFFEEFPFLKSYTDVDLVLSVKVGIINLELLAFCPKYMTTPGEYTGTMFIMNQRCRLFDKAGHLMKEVRQDRRPPANYRWWKPSTWGELSHGETVEECLKSMGGMVDTIEFAVLDHIPLLWVSTSDERRGKFEVIVYKKPTGVSNLSQWLRDQIEQVRKEIVTLTND